jgi:hypothetical protein
MEQADYNFRHCTSAFAGVLSYSYGAMMNFTPRTFHLLYRWKGVASTTRIKIERIDINHPANNCGDDVTENKSLMGIFILDCWEVSLPCLHLAFFHDTVDGFFFYETTK